MKSIFYSVLAYILIFCSVLLLSNTNNSVKAENLICLAETTPTTQNVNFYGSDNETLLYTAQVPYGSTLNSVKSRNLWANGDVSGVTYKPVKLINPVPKNTTFSLSFFVSSSDIDTPNCLILFYSDGLELGGAYFSKNSRGFITKEYNFDVTDIYFYASNNYTDGIGDTFSYTDIQLEEDSTATSYVPYFDDLNEYVNEQYLQSAGVNDMSTPVSWSTSKESNNMFPFNVPITQDYNLYGYVNDGETITYEGELTSRVSDIGNYALTDIVSLNIDGYYLVRGTYTVTSENKGLSNFCINIPIEADNYNLGFDNYVNAVCFNSNSDYFDFNFLIASASTDTDINDPNAIGLGRIYVDNGDYSASLGSRTLIFSFDSSSVGSTFYFYFSNYAFELYDKPYTNGSTTGTYPCWRFAENSKYTKDTNYMFTENLNYLVDMNSNTNFSYSLLSEDNKSPFYNHNSIDYFSYLLFNQDKEYNILTSHNDRWFFDCDLSVQVEYGDIVHFNTSIIKKLGLNYFIFNGLSDMQYNYQVEDYYFIVDKPTYRVNNALLLYNFDYYNTLYNVNSVVYELSKNGNYYDIVYNGTLPNYKYMYIDNEQINNTIFDRYIFVHFTFNNNNIINLLENGEYVPYYVGFDFNFAYYVEPLISDSSTFEYDFDKPKYKDTGDIFNINWLAVVYNIVVFIAFYFPLTALIFNALGLNYFLGGLLNVISFIFDNPLGNFLLGCLAFIIFFKVLMWFWPIAWDYTKKGFTIISTNERRKAKKEYFKYANERRKQDYFRNRYEGEKISKIEKNRGVIRKGKPLKNKKSRK